MTSETLITFPSLQEGILLRRYKRFLADVELSNGKVVTAHCPNTGPMKSVIQKGGRIRVRHVVSPTRKLAWTWEQAEVISADGSKCWVGVNTALPNTLVRLAIEAGYLQNELGAIAEIRNEVAYGVAKRSRIDLLLKPSDVAVDQRKIYLEIKNTTWKEDLVALFPDTVTARGQKHLRELIGVLPESRAVLVPCLSRNDVEAFAPGDLADPEYGKLFRSAINSGVEVIPCCFGFHIDKIKWEGIRPYKTNQFN